MNKSDFQREFDLAIGEITPYVGCNMLPAELEHNLLTDLTSVMQCITNNEYIKRMCMRKKADYDQAYSYMRHFRKLLNDYKDSATKEAEKILSQHKELLKDYMLQHAEKLWNWYDNDSITVEVDSDGLISITTSPCGGIDLLEVTSHLYPSDFKDTPLAEINLFSFNLALPSIVAEMFSNVEEWEDSDMYCCEFKLVTE